MEGLKKEHILWNCTGPYIQNFVNLGGEFSSNYLLYVKTLNVASLDFKFF